MEAMEKTKKGFHLTLVILIAISIVLLLVYLVLAAYVEGDMKVSRPASGANLTTDDPTIQIDWINASVGHNITRPDNITCYYNASGTWAPMTNNSAITITSKAINFTVALSSLTNGKGISINCSIVNLTGGAKAFTYDANMSIGITIDNVPPATAMTAISGINYSFRTSSTSGGFVTLNVTVTDATIGVNSVYINLSNSSAKQDALILLAREGATSSYSNSTTLNVSLYTEGPYNMSVVANDTLNSRNTTTRGTTFYIDSTLPRVFLANTTHPGNITTPLTGKNYSQVIVLNVTVVDTASPITSVLFQLKNGTSGINATYTATREGTSEHYSYSLNTSHLKDSNYTVTIFANDSAANLNNSATVIRVNLDNTYPTLTFSCSSSVTEGDTVTCTCTGTDNLTGINTSYGTSGFHFTANPSSQLTGTHTVYCNSQDLASNQVQASTTYTVIGAGTPGGSSGSSSSSSSGTASTTPSTSTTNTIASIEAGETKTTEITDTKVGVTSIEITANEKIDDVEINVNKFDSKPEAVASAKAGKVFQYLQIDVGQAASKIAEAKVDIKVEKSWIANNNLVRDEVALFKFMNGQWTEMTTTYKSEDSTYYYYEAAVPSFSYFAIGQKGVQEQAPVESQEPETTPTETTSLTWLWILIVVIVVIIVIALIYRSKKS